MNLAKDRKVALVTGGARGIGLAIVRDLMVDHDVALTWRSTKPSLLNGDIHSIQTDLTAPGACEAVIAEVLSVSGGYRL